MIDRGSGHSHDMGRSASWTSGSERRPARRGAGEVPVVQRPARGVKNAFRRAGPAAQGPVPSRSRRKGRGRWVLWSELAVLCVFVGVLVVKLKVVDLAGVRAAALSRLTFFYPDKERAYAFLGRHYTSQGRSDKAVEACERLVTMKPNQASAWVMLGDAYNEAGEFDKAIDIYHEALRLEPNSFKARLGLGRACSAMRRYDRAIEYLKQAIEIKPDSARAYLSLGVVLSDSGRYDEAMEAFRQAKELDPSIEEASLMSGKAYLRAGLVEHAIKCFKDVIITDAGHTQAHFSLGKAYLQIGDRALATKQQKILQTLDPKLAEDLAKLIEGD